MRGSCRWFACAVLVWGLCADAHALGEPRTLNGFVLDPLSVPADEILEGGPPRDGIPALDSPRAGPVGDSTWRDDTIVVGVALGERARAYPLAILSWHELVNDELDGRPILVSYCPLCGTALVFDRELDDGVRSFGVSGLLYRSDLLLYDRESESLWSQIAASALSGPATGKRLQLLRSRLVTLGEWRRDWPESTVLTADTGHQRDYSRTPYAGYSASSRLMFPARYDERFHPKMPTVGVRLADGAARGYPASEVDRAGGRIAERFEGREVVVSYDRVSQIFRVQAPPDVEIVEGFWFAWSAFHPEATVYVAPIARESPP